MGPALTLAPGGHVAALATSDAAKADAFRVFAPAFRAHDSFEALLADPEIDAVYIPLPNGLHVEWSLKAMKAGKHVLCEKPMAMRAGDYDQLVAARDAAGVLAAEAFMIVHHPPWQLHVDPNASTPGDDFPWRQGGVAAARAVQCARVRRGQARTAPRN
jgi:predicted dehydrogenase